MKKKTHTVFGLKETYHAFAFFFPLGQSPHQQKLPSPTGNTAPECLFSSLPASSLF